MKFKNQTGGKIYHPQNSKFNQIVNKAVSVGTELENINPSISMVKAIDNFISKGVPIERQNGVSTSMLSGLEQSLQNASGVTLGKAFKSLIQKHPIGLLLNSSNYANTGSNIVNIVKKPLSKFGNGPIINNTILK